jgi:hypothetical protein
VEGGELLVEVAVVLHLLAPGSRDQTDAVDFDVTSTLGKNADLVGWLASHDRVTSCAPRHAR